MGASIKQRKAMRNVMENNGNVSKAMRDAGYTNASAKNPKMLTTSKGWEEQMAQLEADIDVNAVIKDGLNAVKPVGNEGNTIEDWSVQHKYLDTFLKLRDKYPAQKKAIDHTSKGESMQTVINIVKPE